MNDQQLHEMAMLVLSKTEFGTKNNPVALAEEMFQNYSKVIAALKGLDNGLNGVCEIDTFGGPVSEACNKK